MSNSVRVDVWLWSVRLFRTRSASTAACSSGNVRVNDRVAKPSRAVVEGDRVTARAGGRTRIVEVVELHTKRVGAPVAASSYVDHSPPAEPRPTYQPPPASREPGSGRPTKRDRRKIEKFLGRDS